MTPSRPMRASTSSRSQVVSAAFVLALALAGGGLAQAPAGTPDSAALVRLRTVEFETALAREPKIYLVLDPSGRHLDIKSRAMVLERVEIDALLLLEFEPLFSSAESPELSAPTVWKITQGPGDTDRETIAPVELRPYSEEEEKEEPAPAAPAAAPRHRRRRSRTRRRFRRPTARRSTTAGSSTSPARRPSRPSSGASSPRSATAGSGCAARSRNTRR